MLADSVERLFSAHSDFRRIRLIESGESVAPLWKAMTDSGFVDALVAEEHGGAGMTLAEAASIALGCGRHLVPVPLAETMVVRAALAELGMEVPDGAIAIAPHGVECEDARIDLSAVPYGMTADWILCSRDGEDRLLSAAAGRRVVAAGYGNLAADLSWDAFPVAARRWSNARGNAHIDWQGCAAALAAARIAGALARAAEMAITYANDRVQFGKPIGKLQAIQQQLAVLAEQVAAARCAAEIGLCPVAGSTWRLDPLRCAVAKARTSEAVVASTAIAHEVHGAIGISEEYDLQMLTRHLYQWRIQYGTESFWNARVGIALLRDTSSAVRFAAERLGGGGTQR
jgi:alkylation response protein AidB-like acyl-CoA dehydrogenase